VRPSRSRMPRPSARYACSLLTISPTTDPATDVTITVENIDGTRRTTTVTLGELPSG